MKWCVFVCREKEEMSAVCVYSLEDITKVMDGPFKELKKSCENWMNPEPVPTPRPGQVHIQSYYTLLCNRYNLQIFVYFQSTLHYIDM